MLEKLILGTVHFGLDYGINNKLGQISKECIHEILDLAYAKDVKILDTAEAYGNSQQRIGDYHRNSHNRFDIITKFYANTSIDKTFSVKERILNDIDTLNIESLYCYMFHSFSDYKKYFSLFKDELLDLKSNGIINKIGVSIYTNEELEEVIKNNEIKLIQLPYNLLDNDALRGNSISKAKEKGVEVHTRSTFLQGLFFKNIDDLPDALKVLNPYLKMLHNLCMNEYKMNELALNYVTSKKYIDKVLIGVDSIEHLESNVLSLNKLIQKELVNQIESIKVKEIELLNPSNW